MVRGAFVGAISGSVGSATFAHGRNAAVIRQKVVPTRVSSQGTVTARRILGQTARAWGALTVAERTAWGVYAASNPIIDRLGQKRILSAQAAFCELNMNLAIAGRPGISDPPVVSAPAELYSLTMLASAAVPLVWVAALPDWRGGDLYGWVSAALISKTGRTRWQEKMKLMKVFDSGYGSVSLFFAPELVDRFGTIQEGQRIVVRFQAMDKTNGLMGAPQIIEGVVSA